ncbi:hypothetical protein CDAR_99361 [Caerostris darwini]|uniref:Uncharacterized protein n=1 Tax=Caerostris darwini TaxID=1538125 RepID=A0AAV4Q4D4_9ARAC|nr:hypothetical protein CDAR_99361 [Caerostris darwini]
MADTSGKQCRIVVILGNAPRLGFRPWHCMGVCEVDRGITAAGGWVSASGALPASFPSYTMRKAGENRQCLTGLAAVGVLRWSRRARWVSRGSPASATDMIRREGGAERCFGWLWQARGTQRRHCASEYPDDFADLRHGKEGLLHSTPGGFTLLILVAEGRSLMGSGEGCEGRISEDTEDTNVGCQISLYIYMYAAHHHHKSRRLAVLRQVAAAGAREGTSLRGVRVVSSHAAAYSAPH